MKMREISFFLLAMVLLYGRLSSVDGKLTQKH